MRRGAGTYVNGETTVEQSAVVLIFSQKLKENFFGITKTTLIILYG